ncbi:MAG: DNRLRE domain-containing protein, partial [Bacteroidales bacterium]|nr:DNRLRE domain-containing protein [Bacteroidales bacterium]
MACSIIFIVFIDSYGQIPVIADANIWQEAPTYNDGNGVLVFGKSYTGEIIASLIKFDLSSIPSNASVVSASLTLTRYTSFDSDIVNAVAWRVTSDWSEGTVTWDYRPSYDNSVGGTITTNATSSTLTISTTSIVTKWIEEGYNNYGFILMPSSWSANDNVWWSTSMESSPSPSLVINYTVPPPDITITNPSVTPTTVCPGGTINVSCDQNYSGTDPTVVYPDVGYYLSTNSTCSTSDTFLGSDGSSLSSTDTYDSESETLTIPSGISSGTYYICFIGDYLNEVSESNESNNSTNIQISVSGTPSTAPSGASADPNTICSGNSTTLTVIGGSLGTGALWKWYSGDCGVTSVGTGSPVIVNPTSTTTYYVRAEGDCNSTSCANVIVNVTPNSSVASVTGTSPLCIGGTATYTANSVELGGGTGAWSSSNTNIATVNSSGLVTAIGVGTCNITYIITGGCGGTKSASQTLTVNNDNMITLTSGEGTNSQSKCINTAITDITYITEGAVGATFTGLPSGVTGIWSANVVTISGTSTVSGTYPYTITLTGGCGNIIETGTITIIPNASIGSVSGLTPLCINETATYTANAVELGGGTGAWSSDNTSVATVNSLGVVTGVSADSCLIFYTISDGCGGSVSRNQPLAISPDNTIELNSAIGTNSQTKGINTSITESTYTTTEATVVTFNDLPAGVMGSLGADVVTISGMPSVSGTFSYT